MKKLILLLIFSTALCHSAKAVSPLPDVMTEEEWNPLPDEAAVVESGRVRFTVLTPEMIRIQYSARKRFEERATFAVVNRRLPVPAFTTEEVDGYLYIKTEKLTLKYKVGSSISVSNPSPNNLSITFDLNGRQTLWYPGKDDALNLLGTSRTLDGNIGDTHRNTLEKGVVSRDGWAIVDESPSTLRGDGSKTYAFDGEQDGVEWFASPVDNTAYDWYFMAYGHEYKKALGDYVKIAGRQPLPPLYMFGYWYSKYQRYTTAQFQSLVREMEVNDVPHDVMIFDMDWHKPGWTGWTWDTSIIPNPKTLITWMHNHNTKVGLNLHPADGVASHEDGYAAVSADMAGKLVGATVPWMIEDPAFYHTFFKNIMRLRESEGVDFWWLDWQQQKLVGGHADERGYTNIAGSDYLSETFWLNHVYYNDMRLNRTDRRPVIFHRWGGMGSHRYPIGFSGDTYSTYGTLAFEPYFTATAANVAFGYWGHDLGGHLLIGDREKVDPEMYLRWLQYGVFSPVLRTHGASQANCERRIWKFDNFDLMNDAVKLRYTLVPYIYTAARQAYDTGVSICRPLYYECPEDNRSYSNEREYMFGDDILVAPVAKATTGGSVKQHIWLPEGKWYDVCRDQLRDGDVEFDDNYTTAEIPYFIRQGSIIPCNPQMDHLKTPAATLVLKVIPGSDGTGRLYEDEGDTDNYRNGAYSFTEFSQNRTDAYTQLTIGARVGTFPGQIDERAYEVEFLLAEKPEAVLVDGVATHSYIYDEVRKCVVVSVAATSLDKSVSIMLIYDTADVDTIETDVVAEPQYNISGQRVSDAQKGIVVTKGRKTLKR